MIETKGVVHFSIPVSDLDRSEAFYREILGLETVSRAPEPLNLLFMKSGDDFVVLVKAKTPINPNMAATCMVCMRTFAPPRDATHPAITRHKPKKAGIKAVTLLRPVPK